MNEDHLVSIIVPSLNGRQKLPKLLDSIANQSYRLFEVIVVIDGSTDDSLDFLIKKKWPFELRAFAYSNSGRSISRNRGVSLSTGSILFFVDDDIELDSTTVQKHLQSLRDHSADISGGVALEPSTSTAEFGRFKAWLAKKWQQEHASDIITLDKNNIYISSANLAMTRQAFTRLGGFDEKLTDAEDYDLAIRAVDLAMNVVYDRTNAVVHHSFDSCVDYIQRQREYRRSHSDLYSLRKGSSGEDLYSHYLIKKKPTLQFIYAFIPGITASWIDRGLFRFLPKKTRYYIYLRVISALGLYYPNRTI